MKDTRINVDNTFDCIVSVQVTTPEYTDPETGIKRPCLPEVLLMIEDENGSHIATFSPEQAAALERAIGTARMQIMITKKQ